MSEYSPLPWAVGPPNEIRDYDEAPCGVEDAEGWIVCDLWATACPEGVSPAFARANAEFIVRAVNSHAELLAALKGLTNAAVAEVNEKGGGGYILARIADARAAIAKAEGQS